MAKNTKTITVSVEDKLNALYELQKIDSSIDKIRIVRGELPLEIEDLNDTILGLDTRLEKFKLELSTIKEDIAENKNTVSLSNELIKKYEKQLKNIKNNREFNSLTKEIEFQNLEIELAEKKQKENQAKTLHKKDIINACQEQIDEKKSLTNISKGDLKNGSNLNNQIKQNGKEKDDNISLSDNTTFSERNQKIRVSANPRYKIGDPYEVFGKWYYPERDLRYDKTGIASWYGNEWAGKLTANGEIFDPTLKHLKISDEEKKSWIWLTQKSIGAKCFGTLSRPHREPINGLQSVV